jgi:hypothetical protein
MKKLLAAIITLTAVLFGFNATAQDTTNTSNKLFVVIKNDGTEYVGKIISQDAREVLIETEKIGRVYIPRHEIREIREVKAGELKGGEFIGEEVFATRYFLTTNGLPIEKNESYILWNLYGPDFQFGIGKNLSVGVMTSWLATPIIGSVKYTLVSNDGFSFAAGTLIGTLSWVKLSSGGFLPYGAATVGNRKSNLSISAGYGALFSEGEVSGRALASVAGMTKVGKKVSLVFDSFIVPPKSTDGEFFALLFPGLRFKTGEDRAFQFGFAGIYAANELVPFPIPMVQWFRKL